MEDTHQNKKKIMKKIIIVGCGGHAAEIVEYIEYINYSKESEKVTYQIHGMIDDNYDNYLKYNFKYEYLGKISNHSLIHDVYYVIAIANLNFRKKITTSLIEIGCEFTNIIHPKAILSQKSIIGIGNVISHNVSIGPLVNIGNFNMINSRATIGHDTQVGDFNFISPLAAIGGHSVIGNNNLIGTNVCTIPKIKIGDNNKIMAGMIVDKPINDNQVVFYRFKEKITHNIKN